MRNHIEDEFHFSGSTEFNRYPYSLKINEVFLVENVLNRVIQRAHSTLTHSFWRPVVFLFKICQKVSKTTDMTVIAAC